MQEEWKDVVGYEGLYAISTLGNIKSLLRRTNALKQGKRLLKEKYMSPVCNRYGYLYLNLWKNKKRQTVTIHRLVAETFVPNLQNLPMVNHKDGNKTNNCVTNLEWCDQSYNERHKIYNLGKSTHLGLRAIKCLQTQKIYPSIAEAARQLKLNTSSVVLVCQGKYKQYKGLQFEYIDNKEM